MGGDAPFVFCLRCNDKQNRRRFMKYLSIAAAAVAATGTPALAQSQRVTPPESMQRSAPALAEYTKQVLFGDVWEREELSPRDRSFVTITTLVALGKDDPLKSHIERGLDNGMTAREIGGIITHLAFYTGWPNAVGAIEVADGVFQERGIPASELQTVATEEYDLPANDSQREQGVEQNMGPISPSLAKYTNGVLFQDLWKRGDLTPRDRSLATVVALTANGNADQLGFHLQRGLANGLTREELGEVMGHMAFYAGWPKAFSGANAVGALDR